MQRKEQKVVQSKRSSPKRLHPIQWQGWILSSFMMLCLIFHTAIIINRKNWRITIKLHFENLSIFLKYERTHMLGRLPSSPCSFLFTFQWRPTSSPQRTHFLNDPQAYQRVTKISEVLYCQLTRRRFAKRKFLKLWMLF